MTEDRSRKAGHARLGPDLGRRERQYVYSVAMKYLKDEDAAEDVTQDALLRAHLHRDTFRGDSRFSTWLYRIAATSALMYLRGRRRRWREVQDAGLPPRGAGHADRTEGRSRALEHRDPRSGPDLRLAAAEDLVRVDRVLRQMGPRYRDVFWMRFAGGYTEAEIAHVTGLHLATVKTRTHRARNALRAQPAGELRAAA